jgi:glycosyltransferase involved in cell wall biosynthesis
MRVLLVSHAFGVGRGSEPGIGWNWATHLSKNHDIWVLAHPEFRREVERHLAERPSPRLSIIWLKATSWDPTNGQAGVSWHYLRWLKQAERLARSLHAKIAFDLVHHVSLATISAPPGLWKLGIPFVWGPVGGAQTCPAGLMGLFEGRQWWERLRPLRLRVLRNYPPFRTAVARSAVLLATNHETLAFLQSAGASDVSLFWDSGVPDEALQPGPVPREQPSTVRVLWAGRFQKRKALPLALEALVRTRGTVPLTLVIAGGGAEDRHWRELSESLGLHGAVEFLGELPPPQMHDEFRKADVFLFTSIRDSCATVVREAMTYGLPIIALNLHGVGAYMPDAAGVKIWATSRASTVSALSAALKRLAMDPELRHSMGKAGWTYAATQVWSTRAEQMSALYRRVAAARKYAALGDARPTGAIVQP